jgi:phosphate starvation-inducible protein PhoH
MILNSKNSAMQFGIRNMTYVFCNARAGTGKTLLAVATAVLLVQYGLYDEVIYVTAAGVQQYKLGYLPGSMEQKIPRCLPRCIKRCLVLV